MNISSFFSANQKSIVGWLILSSAFLFLLSKAIPISPLAAAGCAWLSVFVYWSALGSSAKRQASILCGLGVLMLVYAYFFGISLPWTVLLSKNMPLLTMFVAVSFLSLVTPPQEKNHLPTGKRGFWSTQMSSHILGAVINLSIVFVVGDRLARKGKLSDSQIQILMRSFCAAAFWSPFFVATGVALTYAPGASWQSFVVPGLLMVVPMSVINYYDSSKRDFNKFEGYPLRTDSLTMPIALAVSVLVLHEIWQEVSILTLISILAPLGAFIFMSNKPKINAVSDYINNKQASVSSQFALFLAAGVFSTGITSVMACYPTIMHFEAANFSYQLFYISSALMILFALIGVHPVVTVSIASPLLLPLGAQPDQLAFLFLTVWGIATACSPLSGVGLAMIGRYQAKPKQILKLQWHYMFLMWLSAGLINLIWFG